MLFRSMIQFKLARLLEAGGAYAEARSLHEVALETRRAVLHEEHPDLSRSLMALGLLHLAGGIQSRRSRCSPSA